jgi:hypothetical protein
VKFLCLICAERVMEQLTPEEAKQHYDDYGVFTREASANGQLLGANRLQPPGTAVTVRVRNGKVSSTDGPWVETREQLGGYYLIDARDIDEAVQLAAKIPGAWVGCVEVRPIAEDSQTQAILKTVPGR